MLKLSFIILDSLIILLLLLLRINQLQLQLKQCTLPLLSLKSEASAQSFTLLPFNVQIMRFKQYNFLDNSFIKEAQTQMAD